MSEIALNSQRVQPAVERVNSVPTDYKEIDERTSQGEDVVWYWDKKSKVALIHVNNELKVEGFPESFGLKTAEEFGQEVYNHPYFFYQQAGRVALSRELVPIGQAA